MMALRKYRYLLIILVSMHIGFSITLAKSADKLCVTVMTDGEIDDHCSMIRFLLYTNDVELLAIIQTNSVYQREDLSKDKWLQGRLMLIKKYTPPSTIQLIPQRMNSGQNVLLAMKTQTILWLKDNPETGCLPGIRSEKMEVTSLFKGYDLMIVEGASAPTLRARFYEIGTNRPIFVGRDGVVSYHLSEIDQERRVG